MFNEILKKQEKEIKERTDCFEDYVKQFENILNADYKSYEENWRESGRAYYFNLDKDVYLGCYEIEDYETNFLFLVKNNEIVFTGFEYGSINQLHDYPYLFTNSFDGEHYLLDFKNMKSIDVSDGYSSALKWRSWS